MTHPVHNLLKGIQEKVEKEAKHDAISDVLHALFVIRLEFFKDRLIEDFIGEIANGLRHFEHDWNEQMGPVEHNLFVKKTCLEMASKQKAVRPGDVSWKCNVTHREAIVAFKELADGGYLVYVKNGWHKITEKGLSELC